MARTFTKKPRGGACRPQNATILIAAEGKNATEKNYFSSFCKAHVGFVIHFVKKGSTDPENMMNDLDDAWERENLNSDNGDKGYIVLDLDCSEKKANLIKRLSSQHGKFIVSNPCFEVWFLMHFQCSTHSFANCSEVIEALRKHIPGYQKNFDVYSIIEQRLDDTALPNADKIDRTYKNEKFEWPTSHFNPKTAVPELIRDLFKIEKKYKSKIKS